jgi:rubredoxin
MLKANETARFECGECRFVFDHSLEPVRKAEIAAELELEHLDDVEPICCPFCGDADIRTAHDAPIQLPAK